MAENLKIGRLEEIDLRQVWTSEPYDFTPWLATEDNLQFLSESLGIDGLELIRTEHPVDGFSADIVCRIIGTDHHVLIENQLERTDHTHLGQLLTYAPRFDAKIIIWVAKTFTDAHRAALDWLNRVTGENYAFFGVEVKAVKIADSIPAPLFNVVAKPNEWEKLAAERTSNSQEETELHQENRRYWELIDDLLESKGGISRRVKQSVKGQNLWLPITNDGGVYVVIWRSLGQKPGVGIYLGIYGDKREIYWSRIAERKDELQGAFAENLSWTVNSSGSVYKVVAPFYASAADEINWPSQMEWISERANRFSDVFSPYILGDHSEISEA